MDWFENVKGETSALVAALFWAVATVMFSRAGKRIAPLELNLVKGVIAVMLIVITLLIGGNLMTAVDPLALGLLAVSGIIGIGLGDTAYFESLNGLGPRRALLILMLSPPLAGLIAWFFIGEAIGPMAWVGIALTVGGVAWVITERYAGKDGTQSRLMRGIGMGLIAALAQALGAVLSRAAFMHTSVSPLMAALIRLSAGVVMLLVWIVAIRPAADRFTIHKKRDMWRMIFFATFIGTYLAIWLQQTSFKFTETGIAQTLISTSPLFVLPFAVWMGEKVSLRAFAGVLVALAGIALLFGVWF